MRQMRQMRQIPLRPQPRERIFPRAPHVPKVINAKAVFVWTAFVAIPHAATNVCRVRSGKRARAAKTDHAGGFREGGIRTVNAAAEPNAAMGLADA